MTDIQEIPLDAEQITNNVENNPTIQEDIPQDIPVEDIAVEEIKPIKAKAKGRPKGAPNKGPSKARVKKAQVQETPVEEEEEVYVPSSPKRNLKIPADPSSSDVAAAMLKLLQDQTNSRQSRKQRLYNSWFQ